MIKSKLHNPIIAKNSHIENLVVEKVNTTTEQLFSDLGNSTPIIPEIGRVWFNSESGTFKFANIGIGGNSVNFVDEFLSRTDLREQSVVSKVNFKDSIKVFNVDDTTHFEIDSTTKTLTVKNSSLIDLTTKNIVSNVVEVLSLTDGVYEKIKADNVNNTLTINYDSINFNSLSIYVSTSTVDFEVLDSFKITDGSTDKIVINNDDNTLEVNYNDITVTGNTTFDGNMVVTGDLTVGGQTTKVNVQSESMIIADNIIVLNSNLESNVDPRLASAIVDGSDVDADAGIAVNRGSEGILELIKWVESNDTATAETLKEGMAKVSIWNYEAQTPSYELHQIIDAYTLDRKVKDKSGTSWIGYDGQFGLNYSNAINSGASDIEALEYSFKLDADKLDNTIDKIVQEIDTVKFDGMNSSRVGETLSAGTEFTIRHNLGTVYVDVKIQREESGKWFYDILPIEVLDADTIKIVASESIKIRYMISAIQGFDVNQATDLTIN